MGFADRGRVVLRWLPRNPDPPVMSTRAIDGIPNRQAAVARETSVPLPGFTV